LIQHKFEYKKIKNNGDIKKVKLSLSVFICRFNDFSATCGLFKKVEFMALYPKIMGIKGREKVKLILSPS